MIIKKRLLQNSNTAKFDIYMIQKFNDISI